MSKIYESLKGLITSDMVTTAAETLGESKSKVESGVSIILPSLLAKILKNGTNPNLNKIVEEAGKLDLISDTHAIFKGQGIVNNINIGERFENAVIGLKDSAFMSAIAAKSGLKSANVDRLTNWVSGVIAAYFGKKVVKDKIPMSTIMSELEKEKHGFMSDIPSEVAAKLGLAKKKKMGWLWWVIAIILLLLLFCWWRSCNKNQRMDTMANQAIERVDTVANRAVADVKALGDKVKTELTLPDGKKITVYKGGCEERVLAFLNSDEYKNASAADLRNKWFEFDNIDFKHDSATELMDGSQAQLDNLIAILHNYKDLNIKVGGYADKTGTEAVNMKISEERAEFIKSQFVKGGIPANRISTEGYGEQFAEHAASAPDSERALDRDLALRFDK